MANSTAIDLHASALRSTSSVGDAEDMGAGRNAVELAAVITTCSGTLTLQLETSPDGTTGWRTVGLIGVFTAADKKRAWLLDCDQYVRVKWTLSAAGTATFSVSGRAFTVYACVEDLEDALPSDVVEQAIADDPFRIPRALIKGASEVEAQLGTVHDLPITQWQPVLAELNAQLAAPRVLLKHRLQGGGLDELVASANAQAKALIERIQTSRTVLPNMTPDASGQGPRLSSGDPDAPDELQARFAQSLGTIASDF